ncbi:hypothetical protein ACOZ38_42165 [Sphaerisporangium viridialbum]|uniref:hypothetical protein n=1 Tax=Sphaerisporangium viridialbum TaxID=46189 RepID=UPI003C78CFB8
MNALSRAALVGAVIAVAELLIGIYFHPEDDFAITVVQGLVPFPLGFLLGWAVRLPRWAFVAAAAPLAMGACLFFEVAFLPYTEDMTYRVLAGFTIAVAGYLLTAWLFTTGNWVPRASVVSAIFIAIVATSSVQEAIRRSEPVGSLPHYGVPIPPDQLAAAS